VEALERQLADLEARGSPTELRAAFGAALHAAGAAPSAGGAAFGAPADGRCAPAAVGSAGACAGCARAAMVTRGELSPPGHLPPPQRALARQLLLRPVHQADRACDALPGPALPSARQGAQAHHCSLAPCSLRARHGKGQSAAPRVCVGARRAVTGAPARRERELSLAQEGYTLSRSRALQRRRAACLGGRHAAELHVLVAVQAGAAAGHAGGRVQQRSCMQSRPLPRPTRELSCSFGRLSWLKGKLVHLCAAGRVGLCTRSCWAGVEALVFGAALTGKSGRAPRLCTTAPPGQR